MTFREFLPLLNRFLLINMHFFLNKILRRGNLAIVLFFILFFFFSTIYLTSTRTNVNQATNWGVDQACFIQPLYNSVHGDFLFLTSVVIPDFPEKNFNSLIDRFAPIILIILPFYKLFPSPFTLIIFETILVCLAAAPLYLLARIKLKNDYLPLVFVFALFFNPVINYALLQEFRVVLLSIPFFFSAFLFYETRKIKLMSLTLFLAAMTQEQSFLYVGLFGLWIALREKEGNLKKVGWVLFLTGLLAFISVVFLIQPFLFKFLSPTHQIQLSVPQASRLLTDLAGRFLEGNFSYFAILFSPERIGFYFIKIIVPLAFLPFFSSVSLIGIPEIFQNAQFTSDVATGYLWRDIYLTIFAIISSVYALAKIKNYKIKMLITFFLVIFSLYFGFSAFSSHLNLIKIYGFKNLWTNNTTWYKVVNNVKESLPPYASVAAQNQLTTLLSERKYIYWDVPFWRLGKYKEYFPDYFILTDPAPQYFKLYKEKEQKIFLPIFLANYDFDSRFDFVYVYKNKHLSQEKK